MPPELRAPDPVVPRAPATAPPPDAWRPADPADWARALDAARAKAKAYGAAFAAVRDGQLLWTGTSGRDRDGLTTLAADHPMVIGSATKTFVAAAILQLAEEGQLDLDESARRYLPELRMLDEAISVRQLLDHTSGLADLFNESTRRALETAPERGWTADRIFASLHAPWYQPGEGWAYANTNYYLLGMVVERLTGSTLDAVVGERFLTPLGLNGTRLVSGADGDPLDPAWATIFWGSGAMAAPAADLARWGDALYAGDVLRPDSRREMLRLNDHDYGLGVQRIWIARVRGYGHTGLLNAYTTLLFHVPREDVTLALLVNRTRVDLDAVLRATPAGGPSLLDLALGR